MSAIQAIKNETGVGDVIGGNKTSFSTTAGFAAALTAITGAVVASAHVVFNSKIGTPLQVAALALIGFGALAWAIAGAGDILARAYASAHIIPASVDANKTLVPAMPVLQWALSAATPQRPPASGSPVETLLNSVQPKTAASPASDATSPPSSTEIVALPAGITVNFAGDVMSAIAIRVTSSAPDEVSVLAAGANGVITWLDSADVKVKTPAPPGT